MRERSFIKRVLLALTLLIGLSLFSAPAVSANCIGGADFVGVSPGGPVKIGEGAYEDGANRYTVPEWYGLGAPPITNWYMESNNGVVNPSGDLCSTTTDFGGIFNQGIPQGMTSFTAGLLGIDYALLDFATVTNGLITNTQSTIENLINSGPYERLYTLLAWIMLGIGTITILLLVVTQDQRDRSDLMRTLMSGGSVTSRKSAAIKEVGWIVASIMVFGAILAGIPFLAQGQVDKLSSELSGALTTELSLFTTEVTDQTSQAANICLTNTPGNTDGDVEANIKCNLYRIYQWTPWLVVQFGSTNPTDFAIDLTNERVTNSEELKIAVEQVRAKFGDEAANLAPYLQMQILQGNNNEGYSGVAEMSPQDRVEAFKALGFTIDESASSQQWALQWSGQGGAKFTRAFEAFMPIFFVLLVVWPILTLVLLAKVIAVFAAAILPVFGLFFAILMGIRSTRKKSMKLLKWWIYAILIGPIVALALSLSLSVALIFTGLIDFSGFGLFLYLIISSIAFMGTLGYLIYLFRGQAKRVSGTVDGSADEPGIVSQALPTVGAAVGHAIAPGIGGAIGGAIGAGVANSGEEPRPNVVDDIDGGYADDENDRQIGGGMPLPKSISSGTNPSPYYSSSIDDDEIWDAEIIEDNEFSGKNEALPISSAEGWGGEEPRVGAYIPEPKAISATGSQSEEGIPSGSGEERIQQATVEGIIRIAQTANAASIFLDNVAATKSEEVMGSAEDAARAFADATQQVSESGAEAIRSVADEAKTTASAASEQIRAEGEGERRRLFRSSSDLSDGLDQSTQAANAAAQATQSIASEISESASTANRAAANLGNAADEAEFAAGNLGETAEEAANQIRKAKKNK